MQGFLVSVVDVGESSDGHAGILGLFDDKESAMNYVLQDMKDMAKDYGSSAIIDTVKLELWRDLQMDYGELWTIHDLSLVRNLTEAYKNG